MVKVILGMALSLDGFSNDRDGRVGLLYPDLAGLRETQPLQDSMRNTGAVVMGRYTFAMAADPDSYAGNYEYQVPIFVLTHAAPVRHPKETEQLTFTFVTDGIGSAIAQAKAAAGAKDVSVIGGAQTAQQVLRAGLADEVEVDIMPILLGGGLRPFDSLGPEPIKLERLAVVPLPDGGTHLRFRVVK